MKERDRRSRNFRTLQKTIEYVSEGGPDENCVVIVSLGRNNKFLKNLVKGTFPGLRQFLGTESPLKIMKNAFHPLKIMKNAFHFSKKGFLILEIFKILSYLFLP